MCLCHFSHRGQTHSAASLPSTSTMGRKSSAGSIRLPRSACITLCQWLIEKVTPMPESRSRTRSIRRR